MSEITKKLVEWRKFAEELGEMITGKDVKSIESNDLRKIILDKIKEILSEKVIR